MGTSGTKPIIAAIGHIYFLLHKREKREVPFNMTIGNRELLPWCFPKHSHLGTVIMK